MPLAHPFQSVLVVVDLQPSFLSGIDGAERVLARSEFLVRAANLLEVPCIATEQYPSRMGGTAPQIAEALRDAPILPKMHFSCCGSEAFEDRLPSERPQVILIGIETHICVCQTALRLLARGKDVLVCADAVGARDDARHRLGLERMSAEGVQIAHTESIAYEWMDSAEHPRFREVLALVKAAPL